MGLTRARVYQLLNEINDIMAVRWPNGRHQMYELREKLVPESKHDGLSARPAAVLRGHRVVLSGQSPRRRRSAGALLGEEDEDEIPSTPDEAFEAAIEGPITPTSWRGWKWISG